MNKLFRKNLSVVSLVLCVCLTFGSLAGCDSSKKEEPQKSCIRDAVTILPKVDEDEPDDFTVKEGESSFSHGSIMEKSKYPGWRCVQIHVLNGKEERMTLKDQKMYVTGDPTHTGYLGYDTTATTSPDYDLCYVFTAPCRVMVDAVLNVTAGSAESDGVAVCAYRNDTSHCIINDTIVTETEAISANSVILDKDDKLYFRYGKNGSHKGDEGNFYVKLNFVKVDPSGEATKGEMFKKGKNDRISSTVFVGANSYSHGAIKYASSYPYWSAVFIDKSGKETPMLKSDGKYVIKGDTEKKAYFSSESYACPSEDGDMAYVYTMPCRAQIDLAMTAGVREQGGDGIRGLVYVNNQSSVLIPDTLFKPGENNRAVSKKDVILNKGDKIYFRLNKNKNAKSDTGTFYGKITYVSLNPSASTTVQVVNQAKMPSAGTISYSHGAIKYSDTYPFWNMCYIPVSGGKMQNMVFKDEKMVVPSDTSAFFGTDATANPSSKYDLLYVYTMPCRARVDVGLTASVSGSTGNGVVGCVYVNDTTNMLVDKTVFKPATASKEASAVSVILEKGDKVYFRYNCNSNATGDAGTFYGKIKYDEINPVDKAPENGTVSFSHGSVRAPGTYPYWKAYAITPDNSKKLAMVKDGDRYFVPGDDSKKAYLEYSGFANPSAEYDLVYEYTMPCKADVGLQVSASVTSTDQGGDGVTVSCYINDVKNMSIAPTAVTSTTKRTVNTVTKISLNKGDKIYFRLNPNKNTVGDTGYFYGTVKYGGFEEQKEPTPEEPEKVVVEKGTVSYSHGSLNNKAVYPCWETKAVELSTGKVVDMVKADTAKTVCVPGEKTAFFNASGNSMTSNKYDMMYVYTMPERAKIDIAVNAHVSSGSNGVNVFCYKNSEDKILAEKTTVTKTSNSVVTSLKNIVLDKGEKLYFRLNSNGDTECDYGMFYAKITYVEINPDNLEPSPAPEEPTPGPTPPTPPEEDEPVPTVSWQDMVKGGASGKYYAHGWITNPTVYPYWSAVTLSADGKILNSLVVDAANSKALRVSGDSGSLFRSDGMSYPADKCDMAYVYTMPCTAKINIALNASVTAGGDGTKVRCYLNDISNELIPQTTVTNTSNKTIGSVNGITLKQGDKIFFVLNKNGDRSKDTGYFYGAVTYLNEAP